jgi:antitoxin PrlF
MNAIVSEKGQITIPKPLRDKLGLRPGTVLEFAEDAGLLIAKKKLEEESISKWRGKGKLPAGLSVDSYLGKVRDADSR